MFLVVLKATLYPKYPNMSMLAAETRCRILVVPTVVVLISMSATQGAVSLLCLGSA